MNWTRPALPLVTLLAVCPATAQASDTAQGRDMPQAVAPAGQTATLNVVFDLRGLLLSRDAPNTLRLDTPWGAVEGRIGGPAHPDALYSGYYGSVRPLALRVPVPAGARPGAYPAKLSAWLFTCEQKRGLCARRDVNVAVVLRVLAPGALAAARPLRLTDDVIAPARPVLFR